MTNISKYITFEEAVTSQTAIRHKIVNEPTANQIVCMQLVGIRCFDVIREHFGVPLKVSSFFRSLLLNNAVGGAKNSQHCKGQAIDIQGTGAVTNAMIFEFAKNNLDFDQLIWEFGNEKNPAWVHISYVSRELNRKQILTVK